MKTMEQANEIIAAILCILVGTFTLVASVFNWEFFFQSRRAKIFLTIFRRKGARIFYSALGVLLFYVSFKMLTQ